MKNLLKYMALALGLSAAAPAQAITYTIDFDGGDIDIMGSITTNDTLGNFNSRASFRGIVTAVDVTFTSSTETVTYTSFAQGGGSAGQNISFAVDANQIFLTTDGNGGTNSFVLFFGQDASPVSTSNAGFNTQRTNFLFGGATETGLTGLTFTAIPLPGAAFLLIPALGALVLAGRRRA
ncbi:MAG: VPLPA-CTERM sorting domain-containing protein [Pseudomonadota bacterium]